ncbi:MAG: UdgX family uracil-DNA binding protein [Jiangellaceae bacterium]
MFGEGDSNARVVFVGEQPGDQEDRSGRPFVGPAGRILDSALEDAGIARSQIYVTNAVKRFKFRRAEGGRRRIHQSPSQTEICACQPWFAAELHVLDPDVLVCLGATAGNAVFGPSFKVTEQRGIPLPSPPEWSRDGLVVVATVHPSAVLRSREQDDMYAGLVSDLRVVATELHDFGSSPGQRGILTGVQRSNRASIASDVGGGDPREVTWRDGRE